MMEKKVKLSFFLAGIIQGSIKGKSVFCQDYRKELRRIILKSYPEATVFCPVDNHPRSLEYDDEKAATIFHEHVEIATQSDLVIVYLPEASLGSAIEMWEAKKNKVAIISISPMTENWVVRILSDHVCLNIDEFRLFIESGGIESLLSART